MTDIKEFLTARLTEMRYEAKEWRETEGDPGEMDVRWYKVPSLTPRFVLADCDAKLRVIKHWPDPTGQWTAEQADAARAEKSYVLKLFALPFADHPEYQEEWKP